MGAEVEEDFDVEEIEEAAGEVVEGGEPVWRGFPQYGSGFWAGMGGGWKVQPIGNGLWLVGRKRMGAKIWKWKEGGGGKRRNLIVRTKSFVPYCCPLASYPSPHYSIPTSSYFPTHSDSS